MSRGQNKTQEMSVEEILNSIRRVIGDEHSPSQSSPSASIKLEPHTSAMHPHHNTEDEDDILELTTPISSVNHTQRQINNTSANTPGTQQTSETEQLLSHDTINHTTKQIDELMSAVGNSLKQDTNHHAHKSIDHLVADLLKPQLKQWLDENLPGLVTTIVRQEINRITSQNKTK